MLVYGHYDVQPPDPLDEWISPPFEPTIRGPNLYARGAVDDKGQVFTLLKAYEAVLDADGRPPLNVNFIIEGEEECGGDVIVDRLNLEPERTHADAVLVADMGYYAPGIPAVYTALRGMCYAEIHLRTLERDLHSGTYGGVAPNALEALCRLLMDLKGVDGRIHIRGLYDQVVPPTEAELEAWRGLPFNVHEYMKEEVTSTALTGLKEYSILERTWALPTFEIHGIMGGFTGEGAKTVIPAKAAAKVSLRLVPGLTRDGVQAALEKTVQALAPTWATAEVRPLHGADPVEVDVHAAGVLPSWTARSRRWWGAGRYRCGRVGRSRSFEAGDDRRPGPAHWRPGCPITGCIPRTRRSPFSRSGTASGSSGRFFEMMAEEKLTKR